MPDASVHLWLQLCTEEIWQGTMEQITKLDIQPAELPEEALTQIYQVTDTCLQSYATWLHSRLTDPSLIMSA
jgi:hypothetical protein